MKIDHNYRIESDGRGCQLVFEQTRENQTTGKTYQYIDRWYYPNVEASLRKYLDLQMEPCEDVAHLLEQINKTKELIINLYKNGISI